MSKISVESVSKRYAGTNEFAIRNVDFGVEDGEIFMLLGPSGCGKTTTMDIIAGFIDPTDGSVLLNGEPVEGPGSERGMIFQGIDTSIFPWMTALENVEFGLKMNGYGKAERREIAEDALETVGLLDSKDKRPEELSGGMKQRVQLARSLAVDPDVLLADEPFGSLDAQTKLKLQQELYNVWQDSKKTIIFVTHDIDEAVKLGHRIAVFTEGPEGTIDQIIEAPDMHPTDTETEEFQAAVSRAKQLIGVE